MEIRGADLAALAGREDREAVRYLYIPIGREGKPIAGHRGAESMAPAPRTS